MNPARPETDSALAVCELPDWIVESVEASNTDFESRVVCLAQDARWLRTGLEGVEMRLLESVPGPPPRLVLQLKINDGHAPVILDDYPDLEILIQKGQLNSENETYCANWYFRLPQQREDPRQRLVLRRAKTLDSSEPVVAYLAIGHMQPSDTARRCINTLDKDKWLPGPIDGIEVLAMHGHGTGNVMLVRWNKTTAFKTRLDPCGEELLVLQGAIHDAHGFYPQNTWIRNPISAWQAWGAKAGTVVYYKNGHFAPSQT